MDRYARIVFGFHGTDPATADRLVRGDLPLADWKPSTNEYDWLGHGIYFWEYAPERATEWAGKGGVVGAIINLGTCLDLTDTAYADILAQAYQDLKDRTRRWKKAMPVNRAGRRDLDCAVINFAVGQFEERTGTRIQTVRGAFLEGDPMFPGSGILRESHVQVAVRDPACIIGGVPSNVRSSR